MTTTDEDLLARADEFYRQELYFRAQAALRQVRDESLLTDHHRCILRQAEQAQHVLETVREHHPEEEGWNRQAELHG